MKFKQFLNEIFYKLPKEYEKYKDIFSNIGISLDDGKYLSYPYTELLKDKNFVGYFNYNYLPKFSNDNTIKSSLNFNKKKIYHEGKRTLYSYDINNEKLNNFSRKNNIYMSLIGPYDLDKDTTDEHIGGVVSVFKRKNTSKYVKQLKFESINEEVYDPSILKVIFLEGSPGSGKTYISDKITSGLGFKKLNIDDVIEHRFTKNNLSLDFEKHSPNFIDREYNIAKEKTSKRRDMWVNGRLGLIIDGTGKIMML